MRLKLLGFVAVIAVLLVAGGWWFASPWWTLKAMREAAAAHDEKALSAHVDYPALRASVKSEIAKQMAGSGGGEAGGTLATVVAAIAGPIVDAAITPQGVQAMFEVRDGTKQGGAAPATEGGVLPRPPAANDRPAIERDGIDQFRVRWQEQGTGTMVFRRHGLGWKLVGIDLPPAPASSVR